MGAKRMKNPSRIAKELHCRRPCLLAIHSLRDEVLSSHVEVVLQLVVDVGLDVWTPKAEVAAPPCAASREVVALLRQRTVPIEAPA